MDRPKRRYRRNRKGKKAGFSLSLALTAGIMGMSICQVIVWAAPQKTEAAHRKENTVPAALAEQIMQVAGGGQIVREAVSGQNAPAAMEEQPGEPLVAIDPGHGGMDSGCVGKSAEEKDINLQIALRLEKKLTEKGYRVLMLREKDELIGKMDRVEIANSYQADIYVSIHQNTYEGTDKSVNGIETWYDGADTTRDNERLALLVHRETVKSTGAKGRGVINSPELYVASKTLMPACLIETGFLSNPQEEELLVLGEYQESLAEGIARGIDLYFHPGIMYVPFEEAPWRGAAIAEV